MTIISDLANDEKHSNQAFINDKNTNGVGDGEEGHIDTETRPLQCRLRSTFFNLDLKLEKLGDSTTNDGNEFQQSICLL